MLEVGGSRHHPLSSNNIRQQKRPGAGGGESVGALRWLHLHLVAGRDCGTVALQPLRWLCAAFEVCSPQPAEAQSQMRKKFGTE